MIPLTNTDILAPVIAGFAFEHLGLDSLVSEFEGYVTKLHKRGMSRQDINAELFKILKKRNQTVMTMRTTRVYREPPEAAEYVSRWLGAKTISKARDKIFGVYIHLPFTWS